MIRRAPMGATFRPLGSGSRGTEATAFIQCIDGREPQIYKCWCLGLDKIFRGIHPTAHAEVPSVTVEEFVTNCLA